LTELLLGIDIGTASSKGVLVRPDGEIVAEPAKVVPPDCVGVVLVPSGTRSRRPVYALRSSDDLAVRAHEHALARRCPNVDPEQQLRQRADPKPS